MNLFKAAARNCARIAGFFLFSFLILIFWGMPAAHANGVNMPIGNGQVVYGTVNGVGEDDYTFYVPAGGSIMVSFGEVGAHNFDVAAYLYNPSGVQETGTYSGYYGTLQYNYRVTAGTWKVAVQHWQGYTSAGNYSLTVIVVPGAVSLSNGDSGGQMYPGTAYTGSNYRNQVDVYTFQGKGPGTNYVTFTVTNTGGTWGPEIYLYGPDGSELGGNYGTGTVTYPQYISKGSGTYTALIYRAYYLDNTGTYSVSFSGNGADMPVSAKPDGVGRCLPCEAAKKALAAGEQPPAQSGEVSSTGSAATP